MCFWHSFTPNHERGDKERVESPVSPRRTHAKTALGKATVKGIPYLFIKSARLWADSLMITNNRDKDGKDIVRVGNYSLPPQPLTLAQGGAWIGG